MSNAVYPRQANKHNSDEDTSAVSLFSKYESSAELGPRFDNPRVHVGHCDDGRSDISAPLAPRPVLTGASCAALTFHPTAGARDIVVNGHNVS